MREQRISLATNSKWPDSLIIVRKLQGTFEKDTVSGLLGGWLRFAAGRMRPLSYRFAQETYAAAVLTNNAT